MAKITTLLFDFDGTLFDTNELIIQTFQTVLNAHYPGSTKGKTSCRFSDRH